MYRKPCICPGYLLAVLKLPILEKISAMFNVCKYICTNEFLVLGNNESSIAIMSHNNYSEEI